MFNIKNNKPFGKNDRNRVITNNFNLILHAWIRAYKTCCKNTFLGHLGGLELSKQFFTIFEGDRHNTTVLFL